MKEIIVAAAILYLLSRKTKTDGANFPGTGTYRGMRNNNPGNIRITANPWLGKIPVSMNSDGSFEQFYTMEDGVRAALVNMRTHYKRGKNNIRKMVTTWAPYSDNEKQAVDNYIQSVSNYAGIDPDNYFEWNKRNAVNIAYRIFRFENNGEGPAKGLIKKAFDRI